MLAKIVRDTTTIVTLYHENEVWKLLKFDKPTFVCVCVCVIRSSTTLKKKKESTLTKLVALGIEARMSFLLLY